MTDSWHLDPSVKKLYLFFGRHAEIAWINEQLVRGQSLMAIYGPHRIGKTSLLHALIDRLPQEYVLVYLDADKIDGWDATSPILQIAGEVGRKVREQSDIPIAPPEESLFAADPLKSWQDYVSGLDARLGHRKLILLLDNAELLAPEWLHILLQTPLPVIMTAESYNRLTEHAPGETIAAPSVILGPLENEAAEELVKALVTPQSPIDPWAVRRLLEVSSNQPYYIHLICRVLIECCAYVSPLMPPQVETALHTLLERPIGEFIVDWQSSLPREQVILAIIGALKGQGGVASQYDLQKAFERYEQFPAMEDIAAALDGLVQRRILEKMGANSYRFRLELFRLWVNHYYTPEELFRKGLWRSRRSRFSVWINNVRAALARRRTLWLSITVVLMVAMVVFVQPFLRQRRINLPRKPTATATIVTRVPTTPTSRPTKQETPQPPQPSGVLPGYDLLLMSRPNRSSSWQLYAMDVNTGKRVRLAETSANDRTPRWSPDGTLIAFASDRDGDREIYVMDLEAALEDAAYQPKQLTENNAEDWQPCWSPDGTQIAFSAYRDGNWEIFVMDADGGNLQRITDEAENDISPAWSPDGKNLLFVSRRTGDADLFTYTFETGEVAQLTTAEWDEYDPAWSPDGEWIAFATQLAGYGDIFIVRADGSGAVNLTQSPALNDFQPTWSADGQHIVFVSYSSTEDKYDLFTIGRDGSQLTALTDEPDDNLAPHVRPGS